jgi:hypothetical protein
MSAPVASLPDGAQHRSLRAAKLWGVAFGLVQAATPLLFWWSDAATVYAIGTVVIASIYIGFAVADGRPKVIAVESGVALGFVIVAAVAVTGPRGCWSPGWPDTGSRISGSTAPTSSPTLGGGRPSALSSTSSSPCSSRSRSPRA